MAALLVVASGVIAVQYGRLGQSTQTGFPPDAPPAGVAVFYVREPGNPHGLVAYDWSGTRRGRLTMPTWVEIARLHPAPDGSGFFLNPATSGDYAAYFDRAGRTLFESDDPGFISQTWADDSTHVCVLTDRGLAARLPGPTDHPVPVPAGGGDTVAACSMGSDTAVLASSTGLDVIRLSTGKSLRTLTDVGTVVASTDAGYIATSSVATAAPAVYKTSDLSAPAAQLDSALQPLTFSGDDSLLLVTDASGVISAIAWRTGRVAWSYNPSGANVGLVVARPSGADFILYLTNGTVLVRRDGTTRTFG